jgi:phage antirepressor YoqD-like protein
VSRLLDGDFVYRDERKKLRPYAKHVESGLFWEKAVLIPTPTGDVQTFQVKITGKGQQYFLEKYLPRSILSAESGFGNDDDE